jgi:hypothetical protein
MREAALGMLTLLTDRQRLSKDDAYSLMSVAADFGVTQVVDGRQGIHMRMPRGIFLLGWRSEAQLALAPPNGGLPLSAPLRMIALPEHQKGMR